jgi:hypothetical protein
MGFKQGQPGCPCCTQPCGCTLSCGTLPCVFPKTDLILTLKGSGSSGPSTCTDPAPGGGCKSTLDQSISVNIPLGYSSQVGFPMYGYGTASSPKVIDPVNPNVSGQIFVICQTTTLELTYNTKNVATGQVSNGAGFVATSDFNFGCPNPIRFPINPPITINAYCPQGCNNQGYYSLRQYYEAFLNLTPASSGGFCTDICVNKCLDSVSNNGSDSPGTAGTSAPLAGAIVTIQQSGTTNQPITGVTGNGGCVTLEIATTGFYNINIQSQYGVIKDIKFLACNSHSYWFSACFFKPLHQGFTWQINYNQPGQAAALNSIAGLPQCSAVECNLTGCGVGVIICGDCPALSQQGCGQIAVSIGTTPNFAHVTDAVYCPETLSFSLNRNSPFIPTLGYISEVKLQYAYIIYSKAGSTVIGGPGGCACFDSAVAFWSYLAIIGADPDPAGVADFTVQSCNGPQLIIATITVPGISMPFNTCPTCPSNSPFHHCASPFPGSPQQGWCGDDAISQATDFVNNLPQTMQYGDFGNGILDFGSFSYSVADPSGFIINCQGLSERQAYTVLGPCCSQTPFSQGFNTLVWSA